MSKVLGVSHFCCNHCLTYRSWMSHIQSLISLCLSHIIISCTTFLLEVRYDEEFSLSSSHSLSLNSSVMLDVMRITSS